MEVIEMSPITKKEVIEKLSKEEDAQVLAEVLDFYDYLKEKKSKLVQNKWEKIEYTEPTAEEIRLFQEHKKIQEECVPLKNVIKELNLDGE